jgi:hypothetical protein
MSSVARREASGRPAASWVSLLENQARQAAGMREVEVLEMYGRWGAA